MNTAIIVAAGKGTRFGGDTSKQFLELAGEPVLIHTIKKFEYCREIGEIILVLSQSEAKNFLLEIGKYGFKKLTRIVQGGQSRAESVWKGFQNVRAHTAEIVTIHDGARPLVTTEEIAKTVLKAKETGAACLVAAVTDTVKQIENGKIISTLDRNLLKRALTPQCFRYEILKKAYEKIDFTENVTDECYLVEKIGQEIFVVEGSPKNIKITVPQDLELAKLLIKH